MLSSSALALKFGLKSSQKLNKIILKQNLIILKNFSSWYKKETEENKVEVNVRIKEDIFDKKQIIEEDNMKYENNSHYYANFNETLLDNTSLEQLILILKSMVKTKNTNFDTWYKAINKFNDFLCNHQASKQDVIEFLEVLNFFQPKILEKKTVDKDLTKIHSQVSFSSKHEDEYNRLLAPKDVLLRFAIFLKKNIKPHLLLELAKEGKSKFENKETVDEGLEDLLGMYDVLFRNIEMKVIDDIKNGRVEYTYVDCIKLITSFSRASEGTNLLYEVLMRKLAKHSDKLEMKEIEMIVNYLPHDLYNNEEQKNLDVEFIEKKINQNKDDPNDDEDGFDRKGERVPENGRTKEMTQFYQTIFDKITLNVTNLNDEKFINFFQGILKIKFVNVDTISAFLNSFDTRIHKSEKDKKFFFDFLQLLAYFLKIEENKKFLNNFDMELLFKSVEEPFFKKYINSFDLKEIATIFWITFHFNILNVDKIKMFENSIKNILQAYINDPKAKIDSMGYESHSRYFDNYAIEPFDLESLNFFIRSESNYKGDLLNLMKKAMKCIELENTHPISRKWFHF